MTLHVMDASWHVVACNLCVLGVFFLPSSPFLHLIEHHDSSRVVVVCWWHLQPQAVALTRLVGAQKPRLSVAQRERLLRKCSVQSILQYHLVARHDPIHGAHFEVPNDLFEQLIAVAVPDFEFRAVDAIMDSNDNGRLSIRYDIEVMLSCLPSLPGAFVFGIDNADAIE